MDEPNLQTVPKPRAYKVLRSASEAEAAAEGDAASAQSSGGHALRTANLRAAFVAPPGYVLLSGEGAQGGLGPGGRAFSWRGDSLGALGSWQCVGVSPPVL